MTYKTELAKIMIDWKIKKLKNKTELNDLENEIDHKIKSNSKKFRKWKYHSSNEIQKTAISSSLIKYELIKMKNSKNAAKKTKMK